MSEKTAKSKTAISAEALAYFTEAFHKGMAFYLEYQAHSDQERKEAVEENDPEVQFMLKRYKLEELTKPPEGEGWEAQEVRIDLEGFNSLNVLWCRDKPVEVEKPPVDDINTN